MKPENEIERKVATTCREAFDHPEQEPKLLTELFVTLEEMAQSILTRHSIQSPPPTPLHCKEGCAYCCHTKHILLTPPEALFLLDIIETCGFRFAVRMAARSARPGCPLLDVSGKCRFYAHRPLTCRAFHSLDVEACKKGVGEDGMDVPVWLPHFEIYTRIRTGMTRGMSEMGRAMPKLGLRKVLALESSTALLWNRWLKGENPFEEALMPE